MSVLDTVTQVVANTYPKAIFKLLVNGVDISPIVSPRLMSLTITDNRGLEADSLEFEISDHDGAVALPRKGTTIEAWIGWSNTGLVYKGAYKVKEREHAGAPDVLRVRATSADLKTTLKQKKERSWDQKTIGDIITTVANDNGLAVKVQDSLANRLLAHIDQNESDANLITRIADEHDAIATVKNGILLFMPTGASQTVTGLDLPTKTITRKQGDNHRFSDTDGGEDVSGVTCYYYEAHIAEKQKVTIGQNDTNTRELRHVCRDKNTAEHLAQAEFNRLKRGVATMSYSMARGDPECIPEMTFVFEGMKSEINEIVWLGKNVVHTLTPDGGFATNLSLEVQIPDADDISQLIDDDGNNSDYTGILAWYKTGKGKGTAKLTAGGQKNPKRITFLYISKATATVAVNREWARLQALKKS